jgi:stage V sporulation protein G
MKITNVRVTLKDKDRLKAFIDITFDDCFVVHGMKVIDGEQGFFVAMPNKKGKDEKFRDICHPINSTMRQDLEDTVLDAYEEEVKKIEKTEK